MTTMQKQGFQSKFSIYENGFRNDKKGGRKVLVCGSLPDLLNIIPKGRVSEVRNRFLSSTLSSSSSKTMTKASSARRERLSSSSRRDVVDDDEEEEPSSQSTTATIHLQPIECNKTPPTSFSGFSTSNTRFADVNHERGLKSELRYRTSVRIMVRPDLRTRAESAERTETKRKTSRSSANMMMSEIPFRAIVKEQFRLPRDLVEKMPSAANSPMLSRKKVHHYHNNNNRDISAEEPPSNRKKSNPKQKLSVASMVRRFETREDFKTRAGYKNSETDLRSNSNDLEDDPPSPKVSSCSSMSSSQGGLRSPDIDEDADLSRVEKEAEVDKKAPGKKHSPGKNSVSVVGRGKSVGSSSSSSSSSSKGVVKVKPSVKPGGESRPHKVSSNVNGNNNNNNVNKQKVVTKKSSSSSLMKKSNGGNVGKSLSPERGDKKKKKMTTTTTRSKEEEEEKVEERVEEGLEKKSPLISNVLRTVNKRSESDGIVLAERPRPEKTVRRCESVDDAAAVLPAEGFQGYSQASSPATIMKGPDDAVKNVGDTAEFHAHYFGDPEPEIRWSRNGKPISEKDSRIQVTFVNGISVLTVQNLRGEDGGKYEFAVSNVSGTDSASASLSVPTPPEPPAGRPFVSDIDFSTKSLTLAWYGSTFDGGSIVTGYRVEMSSWPITADRNPPDTEDWKVLMTGMNSTSYIYKGLVPGREYIFRARCENDRGVSEPSLPSEPVRFQPEEEQEEDEEESSDYDENEEEDELASFEAPFEHRIVSLDEGSIFKRKYGVYDELGRGRFGVVFKVRDKETNETLAAKFVKCRRSEDRQKVRDEIAIMNSLDYAKLLQLAAAYENPKEIIMVMEYIGGGELFEKVVQDDFTLTERDCVLFMKQICAAVGYMHSKDIVHLDLKPENILCKSKKSHQIKIIDFGLTRKLKPPEEVRILFGTPEFVSPEVINYEPVSTTSDMWSVGVVCYVLLSGLSPFMGDTDVETFANITGIAYDFDDEAFENISEEAKDFIKKLLVKNQKERLSAYECLQHTWLAPGAEKTAYVKTINTDKLKSFLMRRKWQKAAHAIRALGRFTSLGFRNDGKGSSSSISGFSTQSADF